ncbi:MAG: 16S rRNA (cytosine(1402)-N(4))-methyltransferase RsmH [Clostridia bacterium]|nr:16S rRNA (cytosine(1402)-N(4))-methyltransferase RsmH [Clostridia bacterium]
MSFHHVSVLPEETIASLQIKPNGIYVDGTAGGGGHSSAIAAKLTTGRLIAIDRDPDALRAASERLAPYPCATVVEGNFSDMKGIVNGLGIDRVDGVLLDIGVSSHQIDTPERGFSFHYDAPLDMRMSQKGTTAADLVNTLSAEELAKIFFEYGEEKFARSIAAGIVKARTIAPVETTLQLADVIAENVPAKAKRNGHPARQCFQALRIAVNGELDALSKGLDEATELLKVNGRLSVITFHSLEDRMVKQRFANLCKGCICPPEFPVCVCGRTPVFRLAVKGVVAASEKELKENARARSAKLRTIERIKEEN